MPTDQYWIALVVACLVGLVAVALTIPALRRLQVTDLPNHRSSHESATPRGGGIALVVAIVAVALITGPPLRSTAMILAGIIMLGGLGFVDDIRGLSVRLRLVIVGSTGGVLALALGSPLPPIAAAGLGALWFAAYVNAFNFMDGINGISALTAAVAGATYVAIGNSQDSNEAVLLGAVLTGSSIAFLPYNFPRARVFLGDAGSYALGFTIAALAWLVWTQGAGLILAISPTLVYLADTSVTLIRRYLARAKVTEAHRQHLYQRMVDAGMSHAAVAIGYAIASAVVVASTWAFGLAGAVIAIVTAAAIGCAALRRAGDAHPFHGLGREITP